MQDIDPFDMYAALSRPMIGTVDGREQRVPIVCNRAEGKAQGLLERVKGIEPSS